MTKCVIVRIVTAEKCDRCAESKRRLVAAAQKVGVKLAMESYDSSDQAAINFGIEHDLDDVPSFVVSSKTGTKSFCGLGWEDSTLEKALREAK